MRSRVLSALSGIFLAIVCLLNTTRDASAASIGEADFWSRLQRTAQLVQQAIDDLPARSGLLQQMQELWQGIDSVHLSGTNNTTIPVDLSWVRDAVSHADTSSLKNLEVRLQSILKTGPPEDAHASLDALKGVLNDPRFEYQPTPTPEIPQSPSIPESSSTPESAILSPFVAQALLVILTILVVAAALVYIFLRLRVQAVSLPDSAEDEPATSNEAREKAAHQYEAQDYRTAIRYLYLASLLLLDERGVIHYDRTLTNREHLQMLTETPQVGEALRPVVETFDRVWYGFEPVDERLFETFRADVDRLMEIAP